MTDEAVLDRVRKLLALATSPNVHEAAAAAARAQALIERHRLERWVEARQAPLDAIEDARDRPLETSRRLRKWKVALAVALAELNGCVAYTLDRGREQDLVLVGRAEDREAVEALWTWLVKQVAWLSATHGEGQSKKWHEGFRIGAVQTIAERLAAVSSEVEAEADDGALVVAARRSRDEAVERYVSERMRLRPGRRLTVIASAWEQGREAGAAIALPKGEG